MRHADNNFDFLRIFAAYLVLFSHQYSLTGHGEPSVFGYQTLGGLALNIFFTLSGFLVTESWRIDPHPYRFAARRFLRIWPGLAVMVLLVVGVLGPALTSLPLREYFTSGQTWEYLQVLGLSIVYRLPGVFASNPLPFINGSLWTLPVEVRWYFFLMIFGLFALIRLRLGLLLVWVVMAGNYFYRYDPERAALHGGDRWWNTELGLFFMAGACLNLYREVWEDRIAKIWISIILLTILLFWLNYHFASYTLFGAFFVVWFGTRSTPFIRRAGRFGDLSYGVYIYAFLVQQTLVSLTHNTLTFYEGLGAGAVLTGIAAFLSWHLVEKQALKLKRRLTRPMRRPPAPSGEVGRPRSP